MGQVNNTLDILFERTPTLYYDVPEGRPSAADAIEVYENADADDSTQESSALGSTAVETNPNTTVDAASGLGQADPRIVYVASTTGISVGRRYLITGNAGVGPSEWVEVVAIDDGVSVTGRHPLRNAYVTSDTFATTRIQATFASAWTSDTNNLSYWLNPNPRYRALFQYRIGSSERYTAYVYFDLVRWRVNTSITGLDVDALCPGWLDSLPTYYRADQGRSLINEALKQVRMQLYGEGKADQMIRNAEVMEELILHKAVVLAEASKIANGGGSDMALSTAMRMFEDRWNNLIRAKTIVPFAQSDGGAAEVVQPARISRR